MCTTCRNVETGEHIETVGQIAEVCDGFDNLRFIDEDDADFKAMLRDDPMNCLCHVDIGNSLLDAGFVVWRAEMPEYEFRTTQQRERL